MRLRIVGCSHKDLNKLKKGDTTIRLSTHPTPKKVIIHWERLICYLLVNFNSIISQILSCNQVNGLHQKIVVKILVNFQQKVQTHLAMGKGNDQSCKAENEVFEHWSILVQNFHLVKGQKVRGRIVISDIRFRVNQLFRVDELLSLSPNIVEYIRFSFEMFTRISETKGPHLSKVNEVIRT